MLGVSAVKAQEDPEYKMEIGAGIGTVTYQGDFSSSLTQNMQPIYNALLRYKFNPRMHVALNFGYGSLKGSSANVTTWYPQLTENPIEFKNNIYNIDLRYEYNFFPYGTGKEYRGARRLSPFVALGLGGTYISGKSSSFAFNMPIGCGVKYKIADRVNIGLEWMMHFTTGDKLDGVKDPYGIKSSGLFKNTDSYSVLQVSLTYDIMTKCKVCNSDRY